jgi:hypothetical protein
MSAHLAMTFTERGGSVVTRVAQRMVQKIMEHFERMGDVQTLATIVCVLNIKHPHTLLQVRILIKRSDWNLPDLMKLYCRSQKWRTTKGICAAMRTFCTGEAPYCLCAAVRHMNF